ncbi:MAG: CPXCG motif-containing cysteine-rich protein [bacterium]|nr:CPXCG motif-containing cysteine-rich protein [bacterium]
MTGDGLEEVVIQCPCCWQAIEVLVDSSVPFQEYVEDCQVCCRPLVMTVQVLEEGPPRIEVRPESD